MKKIKFSSTWLLVAAVPFQIASIVVFGLGKSVVGGGLLSVGSVLYLVGLLLSRKERKAQEAQSATTAEETSEEQASAEQTSEEQAS